MRLAHELRAEKKIPLEYLPPFRRIVTVAVSQRVEKGTKAAMGLAHEFSSEKHRRAIGPGRGESQTRTPER